MTGMEATVRDHKQIQLDLDLGLFVFFAVATGTATPAAAVSRTAANYTRTAGSAPSEFVLPWD